MTEIHAFDPDGTPSPGAQAALDAAIGEATSGLATEAGLADAVGTLSEGLAGKVDDDDPRLVGPLPPISSSASASSIAQRDASGGIAAARVNLPGAYTPTAAADVATKAYTDGAVQSIATSGIPGIGPSDVRAGLGFNVLVGGEQPSQEPVPTLWARTGGPRMVGPSYPSRGWPIASDTFSRANGALGVSEWGGKPWTSTRSAIQIASGRAKFTTGTGNGFAFIDSGVNNHEAYAQLGTPPIDGTVVGVMVRATGDAQHVVVQTRAANSPTSYALWERGGTAGSGITILADSGVTPVIGDVFGVRVTGNALQLIVNGTVIATATTTITTGTRAGLYGHANDSVSAFENFTVRGA